MEGSVSLQLSAKSVGVFEAFYNSLKPIQLVQVGIDIAKPGKLPAGVTEIPFEFPLKPRPNRTLYETYHGVFVNIQYMLKVDMKRGLLNKSIHKECEFIVEYKAQPGESTLPKPVTFAINPENITNLKEMQVYSCSTAIKSVELQLVRVETCGCAEGYAKDSTEIQNIQIADGDVCRALDIPLYMVFPRLFTCPTLATNNFKVEFEVNIVVVFTNDHLVTENFPIHLTRFTS